MKFHLRAEGPEVLINVDDRMFLTLDTKATKEFIRGLQMCVAKAEEYEQAERIITDGAILVRAGVPLGLTSRFKDEVKKEAAWNSDLRRYLPHVKSEEVFGLPTVFRHNPRRDKNG